MNKFSPVTLPDGYRVIAIELDPDVSAIPAGPSDEAGASATARPAGPSDESDAFAPAEPATPGSDARSDRTFRQQTEACLKEGMRQLLSRAGYDPTVFTLKKHASGKPYGLMDGRELGVSISHCRNLLICSLCERGDTGIDVEPCGRPLHPKLIHRICDPAELETIPAEVHGIRLWTVKEAVLKFTGSGLRMAMNKIELEMLDEHRFRTSIGAETITIASFTFQNYWVAVAYRE